MAEATQEAATAVAAFVAYEARALEELAHCASAISPSLHSLLPEIAERLSTQLAAARANGAFWSQMLEDMDLLDAPSEESSSDAPPSGEEAAEAAQADVHGVLLQLRREWSEEGAVERHQSFDPILEALARFLPFDHWSAGNRGAAGGAAGGGSAAAEGSTERRVRVLVPGAGLGRLVFEAAMRGYEALGVESSFCMLLTAHYVMRLLVPSAREATIHPFAHQGLANCRSAADRCRGCRARWRCPCRRRRCCASCRARSSRSRPSRTTPEPGTRC